MKKDNRRKEEDLLEKPKNKLKTETNKITSEQQMRTGMSIEESKRMVTLRTRKTIKQPLTSLRSK